MAHVELDGPLAQELLPLFLRVTSGTLETGSVIRRMCDNRCRQQMGR